MFWITADKKSDISFNEVLNDIFPFIERITADPAIFDRKQRSTLIQDIEKRIAAETEDPNGRNTFVLSGLKKVLYVLQSIEGDINIVISKKDGVNGIIRNGSEGVIKKVVNKGSRKIESELLRFHGVIGPVIKIDGHELGIKIRINQEEKLLNLRDSVTFFKRFFSLSQAKTQSLTEILTAYLYQEESNAVSLYQNHIHLTDDIIECSYPEKHDTKNILKILTEFLPDSTHPDALLSSLTRNLVAPLHYEIKKRVNVVVKVPYGLNQGERGTGKTPLSELIMGRGYDQDKNSWYFQYENVKTTFALMTHLKKSNLPCLYSDLNGDWLFKNKESLKSYSQKGNFASRGTKDQRLNEYVGIRTFDIDTNSILRPDDDTALNGRFASYTFSKHHKNKVDRDKFLKFSKSLHRGFMFDLFREIFEGIDVETVVEEVERFERASQWEEYGLSKLNELCKKYDLPEFSFQRIQSEDYTETNGENIAYAFIDQYDLDHQEHEKYDTLTDRTIIHRKNNPMFTDNQLSVTKREIEGETWTEILFQANAYDTLVNNRHLQVPHRKAIDFMSNTIESKNLKVLFGGGTKSTWMGNSSRHVYGLMVRDE